MKLQEISIIQPVECVRVRVRWLVAGGCH